MLATLNFLKFFHLIVIIILFLSNLIVFLKKKKTSFLTVSLNLNNFIILLIFFIINWTLPFKYFFYFLIKLPYKNLYTYYNLNFFHYKIILNELYNLVNIK